MGSILVARAGMNFTVCSKKYGVSIFSVTSIVRSTTYNTSLIIPGEDDLKGALEIVDGYHCFGGSGEGACGPKFGGFTQKELQVAKDGVYFAYEGFGNIFDGCLIAANVDKCTAVAYYGTKELSILEKITEECKIEVERLEGVANLELNSKCGQVQPKIAMYNGTHLFLDDESRAHFYRLHAPIYKLRGGDWKYRKTKIHHRGSTHEFSVDLEWHGMPVDGIYIGKKPDMVVYNESLDSSLAEIVVTLDQDDELYCQVESINNTCSFQDNAKYSFEYWSTSATGIPLAHGKCESTNICLGELHMSLARYGLRQQKVFGPKRKCALQYETSGPILLEGFNKTFYEIGVIPEFSSKVSLYKDVDVEGFGKSFNILEILKRPLNILKKYAKYALIILALVVVPSLMRNKVVLIAVVFFLILEYKGANAEIIEAIDYSATIVTHQSVQLWWLSFIAKMAFNWYFGLHWTDIVFNVVFTLSSANTEVDGIVITGSAYALKILFAEYKICREKADVVLESMSNYATRSLSGTMKFKELLMFKKSAYAKFNVKVIFGEFRFVKSKKRIPIRGRVRNVRNMNGSLFYAYEYYHLQKYLKCMTAKEIDNMYKYFPVITIRDPMTDEQIAHVARMVQAHVASKKEISKLKM